MEDPTLVAKQIEEKEEALKVLRKDLHTLEAKQRAMNKELSTLIDEETKLKESDPEGTLPHVQAEKKRRQQELRATFPEERSLHEELYRGDKELIEMDDAFLRAQHADTQTRALETLRLIFEAPHYPADSLVEQKKALLLQHLDYQNKEVPLYVHKRDLLERHAWGIDDVILHDFQTLVEQDPRTAVEMLSNVQGTSDTEEANEMLAMAVDAWEVLNLPSH